MGEENGVRWAERVDGAVRIHVRVIPGAAKTMVMGEHDGRLKIRLNAQPEKGKANKELVQFLAKRLGIAKGAIHMTSGETSQNKTLEIFDQVDLSRLYN